MVQWVKARAKPRDLFFFAVGCVIAYHEVWIASEAQPLLIFTVLFLWGLIPAFWGDRSPASPPPPPPEPPSPEPPSPEPPPDELPRNDLPGPVPSTNFDWLRERPCPGIA